MARILLVEDDLSLARNVQQWLRHEKHEVEHIADGAIAADRLTGGGEKFDLIVLDWELPGLHGNLVLRKFRDAGGATPVLMLTARGKIADKEEGYDSGADEYLTKPFDLRELSLRIGALLKRSQSTLDDVIHYESLVLDPTAHSVHVKDQSLSLQPKEFAVLELLLRNQNFAFSTEALMNRVWLNEQVSAAAVNTCLSRLRKKLADSGMPTCIDTAHGFGYVIRKLQ